MTIYHIWKLGFINIQIYIFKIQSINYIILTNILLLTTYLLLDLDSKVILLKYFRHQFKFWRWFIPIKEKKINGVKKKWNKIKKLNKTFGKRKEIRDSKYFISIETLLNLNPHWNHSFNNGGIDIKLWRFEQENK